MMIAGGIVTQKPIGGIVSNNPSFSQAQVANKAEQKQAKVDALVDALAAKHQASQQAPKPVEKRWTV